MECRRLERRYRRTATGDDRHRWVQAVQNRLQLYRTVKQEYWLDQLSQRGRSSAPVWRSLSSLLGRKRDVASPNDYTADNFAVLQLFIKIYNPQYLQKHNLSRFTAL